jgi:hypothetical protein
MNTEDQNQDFTALGRLLKLKRYEQPPPRYFNDFSSQVVARIRAGKRGARFESLNDIVSQTPWLQRLWHALESRPALSGVLAAAACGLMVAAVFLTGSTSQPLDALAIGNTGNAVEPANRLGTAAPAELPGNNLAGAPQLASSTNLGAIRSLFDNMPSLQTVPASGTSLIPQ